MSAWADLASKATRLAASVPMAVYRRPFRVDGRPARVTLHARMAALHSKLEVDGRVVAADRTPSMGPEAVRNHRLVAALDDGRTLEVEAGYVNWLTMGIAARVDGVAVHESHPGKRIAFPAIARSMTQASDPDQLKRNKVPLMVDIALALLFFVVAKLTDLRTAALVGAGAGIALVVAQRFVKTDIIGGLALFGVMMALISAGLAWAFADDMAVKMRTTIVGLIGAAFFLGDGLLLKGRRLGAGMARYLPYTDVVPKRLAVGMGVTGVAAAGLNAAVAAVASTDFWLFYTTFLDIPVAFAMIMGVFKYARGGSAADAQGGPERDPASGRMPG